MRWGLGHHIKAERLVVCPAYRGSLFHVLGPAEQNALWPTDILDWMKSHSSLAGDRQIGKTRSGMDDFGLNMLMRYTSLWPQEMACMKMHILHSMKEILVLTTFGSAAPAMRRIACSTCCRGKKDKSGRPCSTELHVMSHLQTWPLFQSANQLESVCHAIWQLHNTDRMAYQYGSHHSRA